MWELVREWGLEWPSKLPSMETSREPSSYDSDRRCVCSLGIPELIATSFCSSASSSSSIGEMSPDMASSSGAPSLLYKQRSGSGVAIFDSDRADLYRSGRIGWVPSSELYAITAPPRCYVVELVEHHLLDHVPNGVHGLGHDLHLGRDRQTRRSDQLIHIVYRSPRSPFPLCDSSISREPPVCSNSYSSRPPLKATASS